MYAFDYGASILLKNEISVFLSSPIGGASRSYFKDFCPRTRPRSRPRPHPRPRVICFFRMITLESLRQSEPNFHT